jgi:hypothetical protein
MTSMAEMMQNRMAGQLAGMREWVYDMGLGVGFGWLWMIVILVVVGLSIAALFKYLRK